MNKIFALFSFLILLTSSCEVLKQLDEAKQFAECDFMVKNVQIIELGTTDVSEYKSSGDIGFTEMLIFGQQLLSGKFPAKLSVEVRAINNQNSKAAISGLHWKLYMKNEEYGNGKLNKYVEVLPGQSTDFNLMVDFDLMKLLASENLQSILDLVFDIENKEKLEKLDIMLKVKPFYKTGDNIKEYPGYLTIRP